MTQTISELENRLSSLSKQSFWENLHWTKKDEISYEMERLMNEYKHRTGQYYTFKK